MAKGSGNMFLSFIKEDFWDGGYDFSWATNPKTDNEERYVYLLNGDKILKLYITIDEYLVEQNLKLLKDNIPKKDFIYVNDNEFASYNFPLAYSDFSHNNILKQNKYKIPNKNSLNSTLFYILNNIYNSDVLNSDMLNDLSEEYKFRYNECNNMDKLDRICIEVIQNIINNLEIEIEEEYDYNVFEQSVNFMEDISKKEFISMSDILYKLKQILIGAKENKDIFENLKININKEKQLRK